MAKKKDRRNLIIGALVVAGIVGGAIYFSQQDAKAKPKKKTSKGDDNGEAQAGDGADDEAEAGNGEEVFDEGTVFEPIPAELSAEQKKQLRREVAIAFADWWEELGAPIQASLLEGGIGPAFNEILDAYEEGEGQEEDLLAGLVVGRIRQTISGLPGSEEAQAYLVSEVGEEKTAQLVEIVKTANKVG